MPPSKALLILTAACGAAPLFPASALARRMQLSKALVSIASTQAILFPIVFSFWISTTAAQARSAPPSQNGALFLLTSSVTYLNSASGFDTASPSKYTSVNVSASVTFYNDLNGLGTPLATVDLTPNASSCPGYNAGFSPYTPIGVLFLGKEKSIGFGGVTNQIAFDEPSGRPAGGRAGG